MKQGKHAVRKFKIIEVYPVLIFIAALFMSIGYAKISDIKSNIEGKVEAEPQTGVFITEISSTNESDSKINYFIGTMVDSEIILGETSDSSITYEIELYNNSDREHIFIGTITDEDDDLLYSNENIQFELNGLEEYVTTIAPNSRLSFTITFRYKENVDISNNVLKSKLNFRFKETPKLELSNDGQVYTMSDIYPNFISKKYEFIVSNYDETLINNVPMTYYFETIIDKPLSAKIYDENGEEVTKGISINGEGSNEISHKYTMEIIWDNSNSEENIDYNSLEYINREFKCKINLKAIPDDIKYMEYSIAKSFEIDIIPAKFYFNTEIDDEIVHLDNNSAIAKITIKNNNNTDYNKYNTTYKITLEGTEKFTLYVEDEESVNNQIVTEIQGNEILNQILSINLVPKDGYILNMEEPCNIKIETTDPYERTINYQISIIRDLGINPKITSEMTPIKYEDGDWTEADTTIPENWFDYREQRWANVETENGYFIYIPRYAYKITSGYHTTLDNAGTIAIVYLNEDNTLKTKRDSEGNIVNPNDLVTSDQVDSSEENTGINATTKYIIHPAFTAFDTEEGNVDGIWVAKYEMSMERTTNAGITWEHTSTESTSTGNLLISTDTTRRMVSKPGVTSWRNIEVTNIFENCYYMNRELDSHMMKNTEWGAVAYLSMSKYGKGADSAVEVNKSTTYLTGYGADSELSAGASSTTGNMYGVFDMAGGSYEYVAGYLEDSCVEEDGELYSINESLILSEEKYKDVYDLDEWDSTVYAFSCNNLKVGDALWEITDGTKTWFDNEFFFAGMSSGEHYPIFDRGGDYGSWSSSIGINYTGRNNGDTHPGVGFRVVICIN